MTQQELLTELASLGPEGQRQVADFIACLKQEKLAILADSPVPTKLACDPFVGIWKDREDLSNSDEWVRNLRRHEW